MAGTTIPTYREPTEFESKVASNAALMQKMFTKQELAYQLARIEVKLMEEEEQEKEWVLESLERNPDHYSSDEWPEGSPMLEEEEE